MYAMRKKIRVYARKTLLYLARNGIHKRVDADFGILLPLEPNIPYEPLLLPLCKGIFSV